jgi:hypothetical protein
LFKNHQFDKQLSMRNDISLDPSKIAIWKEYFCRFDEYKREIMSHQLQTAEVKEIKAINIQSVEESIQGDISQLLLKLRTN